MTDQPAQPEPTGPTALTAPPARRRWWSPGLLVHAALVAAVVVARPDGLPGPTETRGERLAFAVYLLLASPWWLAPALVGLKAAVLAPAVNVVLHAGVVVLRRPAPGARRRGAAPTVVGVGAVLGAAVWAAWLGWDHTASYDVVSRQVESPYVTLQVLGCALTVGVVTWLLAYRWSPAASAAGVSAGFWVSWTAWAAIDETGMFLIGATMLGLGLMLGTAAAATLGWAARQHPRRRSKPAAPA